jgi:hypothetical protein
VQHSPWLGRILPNAADKLLAPQATGSFIGLFERELRRYHTQVYFASFKSG